MSLVDENAWRRAAAAASLLAALVFAGLVVLMIGLNSDPSADRLGSDVSELVAAAAQPMLYRVAISFDTLAWLSGGTALFCFGGLLMAQGRIRGALLGACSVVAVLPGALGASLRLAYTTALATGIDDPSRQATVLDLYRGTQTAIDASFRLGSLLVAVGLLILATARLRMPRWVSASLWLLGIYGVLSYVAELAGAVIPNFPWQFLNVLITVAQFFGLAWAMRGETPGRKERALTGTEDPL